jgi:hypothetical protein
MELSCRRFPPLNHAARGGDINDVKKKAAR